MEDKQTLFNRGVIGRKEFMEHPMTQLVGGAMLSMVTVGIGGTYMGAARISGNLYNTSKVVQGGTKTFFDGAKYSNKVIYQMKRGKDMFHSFPNSVDGYAARYGQSFMKLGSDGKFYNGVRMQGSYGGRNGFFEYIKGPDGLINHRFFRVLD